MKDSQLALLHAVEKGYYINEDGELYNKHNKKLNGYISHKYKHFGIRMNGDKYNIKFHRLQAYQKYRDEIFLPNILVRHYNGDHLNNCKTNILIGTAKDNSYDIPKHIRLAKAIHASSFTKIHDHNAIKEFYTNCKSYKETLVKFNISSKGTLYYILNKET